MKLLEPSDQKLCSTEGYPLCQLKLPAGGVYAAASWPAESEGCTGVPLAVHVSGR